MLASSVCVCLTPQGLDAERMAPSAARARKAARRIQEEAAAAERALHTVPSVTAMLELAERSEAVAAEQDRVEQAKVDLAALCMACGTTDAAAFSSRMINKRGRHGDRVRRCRQCVAASEAKERSSVRPKEGAAAAPVTCASCRRAQPVAAYSRTQLQKEKARCTECVAAALQQG